MHKRWESQKEHTTTTNTTAQRRCLDPVPATDLLVICPEEWGHWLKRISVSLIFRGNAGTHGPAFSPGPHPLETTLEAPSNWSGFYLFWLVTSPPPPSRTTRTAAFHCAMFFVVQSHHYCCLCCVLTSRIGRKKWHALKKKNYKRKKTTKNNALILFPPPPPTHFASSSGTNSLLFSGIFQKFCQNYYSFHTSDSHTVWWVPVLPAFSSFRCKCSCVRDSVPKARS